MTSYRRKRTSDGYLYYYRCRPNSTLDACPNRKSHPAEDLEYQAARLFERYADRGLLLEIYDRALAADEERSGAKAVLERRAALSERLSQLEAERKGYLRQNARGVLPDAELDLMLAEVGEQREAITAELASVEEAAKAAERVRAVRDSLAASYAPVHAGWEEDPDAITPDEVLTHATHPEDVRRAYRRYGARFEVDAEGTLTLKLALGLGGEPLQIGHSSR